MQMKIDAEFSSLLMPLSTEEQQQLEKNILEYGCRDPLTVWRGILIDGHNRYEICTRHGLPFQTVDIDLPDREAVADWMDANQLGRRNLTPDAFRYVIGRLYKRQKKSRTDNLKQNAPKDQIDPSGDSTAAKIAKQHGVSAPTVKRAEKFAEEVDRTPELKKAIEEGKPVSKVKREIKEKKKEEKKRERQAATAKIATSGAADISSVCDLRICSMQELLASVKPDAIITDPPYPREFIPLYGQMAELAKDVPLVAVMCGQSYLPQILSDMARHMKYRWTLAYLTPGGQAVQQWGAKVNAFWKPVIIFGDGDWIGDVVRSDINDNDKRFHHWGQSVSGMADLVSRLVKPGQLVCDPFLGAGTTAVAALMSGCRFVGCDIDASHVETAGERARQCLM
jgi:hypothetical protein